MFSKTSTRAALLGLVAAPALLALVACTTGPTPTLAPTEGTTAPLEELSVAIGVAAPVGQSSLVQIATDNDLWPENIDVQWSSVQGGQAPGLLGTGSLQFYIGSAPGLDLAAANSAAGGEPLFKWVGEWVNPSDFQFLARDGIDSLEDLKGKSIGVTAPGSTLDTLARSILLSEAGLTASDFTITPLQTVGAIVGAFTAGTIDALVLPGTTVSALLQSVPGASVVYDYQTAGFPWVGQGIFVNTAWAQAHPAGVTQILESLDAALQVVWDDPESAKASLATYISSSDQANTDLQFEGLQDALLPHIRAVSVDTLKTVYGHVREVTSAPGLNDEFAAKMTDASYLEAAGL
jgi:ABC-type nitrate/sulfonate/bicarbonate transport system substrate-binding protein